MYAAIWVSKSTGVTGAAASPAKRVSRIGFASWATIGMPRASTIRRSPSAASAPQPTTTRPSRPAIANACAVPRRGRGSSDTIDAPTTVCSASQPSTLASSPASMTPISAGFSIVAASAVGKSSNRSGPTPPGRAAAPAPDAAAPSPSSVCPPALTVSKSSDSWRPSPPSDPARIGRPEPQPAGRSVPTRAAPTEPLVATSRRAWTLSTALSPVIAGSRSMSVRNSYSRKSRITVSRS